MAHRAARLRLYPCSRDRGQSLCDAAVFSDSPRTQRALFQRIIAPQNLNLRSMESRRWTQIIRVFPNADNCLGLVSALAAGTHEDWQELQRYLNTDILKEHRRESLKEAA